MPADRPARVLVADDHQELLDRVVATLVPHFHVVGTARNGAQLVAAAAALDPDVLVVDISMPVMSGLEALAQIRAGGSQVPAVCLTACDCDMRQEAFDTGALAYIRKAALKADLVPAVRSALAGQRYDSD